MLIVTLGDPYSINIEILSRVLNGIDLHELPCVLIGSLSHWQNQLERLGIRDQSTNKKSSDPRSIGFLNIDGPQAARKFIPAERLSTKARGMIATRALLAARDIIKDRNPNERMAVVTLPIDKHACRSAGFRFPGQTEFFEDACDSEALMILSGPRLRVGLVTTHLSLKDVPRHITQRAITRKLSVFSDALRVVFGIKHPRIAVCGLNPHCSDGGLFGNEEAKIIAPAIRASAKKTPLSSITGPLPADTIFFQALQSKFDGVLSMYHDQGLGPLKTIHFVDAVNISAGLPILRVSPDHGPASDLFLKQSASTESLRLAFDLATRFLRGR